MALNMFNQFDDYVDGKPIRTYNNKPASLNRNLSFNNHNNKFFNNQNYPVNYNKNNGYYNAYRSNIPAKTYRTQPDEDYYYNSGYYKKNTPVNRSNSHLSQYQAPRNIYPVKTRSISEQTYSYPFQTYNQTFLPNIVQRPPLVSPMPIMPSMAIVPYPTLTPTFVPQAVSVSPPSPIIMTSVVQAKTKPAPIVNKIVSYPVTPNATPTLLPVIRQTFY